MLTDTTRPLLAAIEANLREIERLNVDRIEAEKRVKRLKSPKYHEPAAKELADMTSRIAALEAQAKTDTERLFLEACGILPNGIAELQDAGGKRAGLVLVEMMRARQLHDGTAVLTVGGTTVDPTKDTDDCSFTGPWQLLMAAESRGECLTSLT